MRIVRRSDMSSFIVLALLQILVSSSCMEIPGDQRKYGGDSEEYIIGGRNATISEYPYIVTLEKNGDFYCGGTIISEKFILTAAHCLRFSGITVRVGSSFRQKEGVVHQVKRVVPHPNHARFDYDVGVIELESPIEFNENASAIEISDREPRVGDVTTITGYGYYTECHHLPEMLQVVNIPVITDEDCVNLLGYLTERMFCTFLPGKSPYSGDSGSPIVIEKKVVGAVSWGTNRPTSYPTVHAKFANPEIRDFIKKETGI